MPVIYKDDAPYLMHHSELAEDDAEHFTGEYVVFHPDKGAQSFDTEHDAYEYMYGEDTDEYEEGDNN